MIELDFKQMQPSLLFNSLRKKLDKDIYDLGNDFELDYIPKHRHKEIAKKAFLIMLNAQTKKSAIGALKASLRTKGLNETCASMVIEQLISRHKNIEDALFNDSGIKLMYIESLIAEKVIMHFVSQKKIIMPIHDAFLVTEENKEELSDTMISAYNQVITNQYGEITVPPRIEQK